MKKIIMFFVIVFLFVASPVNASSIIDNYSDEYIQYKLESEDTEDEPNYVFWGMLIVAFLAISIFLIAYKSDDGMPDD